MKNLLLFGILAVGSVLAYRVLKKKPECDESLKDEAAAISEDIKNKLKDLNEKISEYLKIEPVDYDSSMQKQSLQHSANKIGEDIISALEGSGYQLTKDESGFWAIEKV